MSYEGNETLCYVINITEFSLCYQVVEQKFGTSETYYKLAFNVKFSARLRVRCFNFCEKACLWLKLLNICFV